MEKIDKQQVLHLLKEYGFDYYFVLDKINALPTSDGDEAEKRATVTVVGSVVTLDFKGLTAIELLGIGEHIKASAIKNISHVVNVTPTPPTKNK